MRTRYRSKICERCNYPYNGPGGCSMAGQVREVFACPYCDEMICGGCAPRRTQYRPIRVCGKQVCKDAGDVVCAIARDTARKRQA